ncbi:MAG TPA: CHAP domain-containing protein [Candidatus Pristimantibacillus sp.]|jgi:peptidoglycan hydrolase CwlO-like protein|nr:CHAP domain-containing protein [Candidatus Pristimantibacillus sp.]
MKQKSKNQKQLKAYLSGALLSVVAVVTVAGLAIVPARADQFDQQIAALQQQNASSLSSLGALQAQAASYQDAINQLQIQIDALQQLINENLTKQHDLQAQIDANEAELARQRELLGQDIKSMYIDGQPSSIEILATSKNLSDFVDKEEYRTSVQTKIQDTLKKITELQKQLAQQKQEIDQLLADQQTQQSQLDANRAAQASLLNYNKSQQATFNSQISANKSKIADLRRQQAILNSQFNIGNMRGDPGNGGYPSVWANAAQDTMIDSWGMYNRECVSYAAYMVHQDYLSGKNDRDMPWWGGRGNANQWDDNARAAGIPVNSTPTPGSIAISNGGFYGHAMYVAAVGTINGQQAIYVQQFNAQLTGQYSEGWRYTNGLVFLHF